MLDNLKKILLENLTWLIPLLVGSLLTIWITRKNEKFREKKVLKALKHELFENFIAVKLYKNRPDVLKGDFDPITEFKTDVYKKAREETVIANLPWNIKKLIMGIYHRISTIQSDYRKKTPTTITTGLSLKLSELEKNIKELFSLFKSSSIREKIKKAIKRKIFGKQK